MSESNIEQLQNMNIEDKEVVVVAEKKAACPKKKQQKKAPKGLYKTQTLLKWLLFKSIESSLKLNLYFWWNKSNLNDNIHDINGICFYVVFHYYFDSAHQV